MPKSQYSLLITKVNECLGSKDGNENELSGSEIEFIGNKNELIGNEICINGREIDID
jgi:hypothetical protein